ncbi:galactose-specific lectin nattectin-like [Branchiostoma floridae]|uniref:Galactose-specific lectin nattectin-like n=1 Tax=Branchiostoma floridae TaxID=7739 RepID=A0A9J7N5V8_BRAFL|nr:galactose-specific lectin nattectin-like [Branchiostoma floridae]
MEQTGQPPASSLAAMRRFRWYGHVLRLPPDHPNRALLDFNPKLAGWRQNQLIRDPLFSPTVSQGTCEPNWHGHGSRCFRVFDVEVSYADARALCLSHNSHLALPKDQSTNDFVKQLRNSVNQARGAWIGLKYGVDEGSFVWEDGEVLGSFDDWGQGQPDGGSDPNQCVRIVRVSSSSRSNQWGDHSCANLYGVSCEKGHRP